MIISGIYKIVNLINNKIYVGSATNFEKRWHTHEWYLNKNKHHSNHLQHAWNKYGADNFEFCAIEGVENLENLIEREQYWINVLKPSYNIAMIAGSMLGTKRSAEVKVKMSAWQIGRKMTIEDRLAMSIARKKNSKWPHEKGILCKCDDCSKIMKAYKKDKARKYRASKVPKVYVLLPDDTIDLNIFIE